MKKENVLVYTTTSRDNLKSKVSKIIREDQS